MRSFNLGPILVLLIFILIPLVNYILTRMQRRFEPPSPNRQPTPDMGVRRQPPAVATPAVAAPRERAQAAPSSGNVAPSRRHWSRNTQFRSRRDMRRVIVAMTVLGPCRAYDPPG